jgi:hypothetical protein
MNNWIRVIFTFHLNFLNSYLLEKSGILIYKILKQIPAVIPKAFCLGTLKSSSILVLNIPGQFVSYPNL